MNGDWYVAAGARGASEKVGFSCVLSSNQGHYRGLIATSCFLWSCGTIGMFYLSQNEGITMCLSWWSCVIS